MSINIDELPALLAVPRAAKILGIPRASAYRYAASGELPDKALRRACLHHHGPDPATHRRHRRAGSVTKQRPAVPGVTVFPRGKSYAFYVDLPPDPMSGKRRREYAGGFPTDEDAWSAALKVKASIDEHRHVVPTKMTVAQFLAEWLTAVSESLKRSTRVNYADYINAYIAPNIGQRRLQEIDVKALNALYKYLLANGRRKADTNSAMYEFWKLRRLAGIDPPPREIAAACGVSIYAARSAVLRYRRGRVPIAEAVRPRAEDGQERSPAAEPSAARRGRLASTATQPGRAREPAAPASTPKSTGATWTVDQLSAWLAVATHDEDAGMWVLVATTGMRRSELAGLRRDQLDLDAGTMTLEDTWIIVGGAGGIRRQVGEQHHPIALDP